MHSRIHLDPTIVRRFAAGLLLFNALGIALSSCHSQPSAQEPAQPEASPTPQAAIEAIESAPSFSFSADVPHDVPQGRDASVSELAHFAWEEFVALNWPALDPATTGQRGRADGNKNFWDQDPGLTVWQTYRHKNELFPADGKTDPSFDSKTPSYGYKSKPKAGPGASFALFNNLDETSEIGLCNMFAHNDIRIAYEAKVNRAVFEYANAAQLTQCDDKGNCPQLEAKRDKTKTNLTEFGGICSSDPSIVSLPCGDEAVPGDAGEGAVEIKAAWRALTDEEARSGRFYTNQVIVYEGTAFVDQQYQNVVYGLVALHIIHKTKSFPTFVFATWEQVDNYDDVNHQNSEDLVFKNTGTPLPNIAVERQHPIHSEVGPVNDEVHAALTARNPTSVWQYYELIGVQGMPVAGPPAATASDDEKSYYYLANIVVETNQTLQDFYGQAPNGVVEPLRNTYLNGVAGSPFQMGGCQGCHGTQGQFIGGDMSRLIGTGPSNASTSPESLDADEAESMKSYLLRSAVQ